MRNYTGNYIGISLIIGGLLALEFMNVTSTWARLVFPRPIAVTEELYVALYPSDQSALGDIAITLGRIVTGLLLGSLIAVPLGLSAGVLGKAFGSLRAIVDFLRSIPQIALFPIFALLFGIDNFGKIMMATVSSFLIVFVAAADGATYGVQERHETMEWMGATSWERFIHLTFPQSLPAIGVGIRIAGSVAVIVVLVAEMLYGTLDGIGYRLYLAQLGYRVDEMWAYIMVIGLLGMTINWLLSYLQASLVPWDRISSHG
ncbi:ABC transporter permease [Endothiovibrio diazotrophicus]